MASPNGTATKPVHQFKGCSSIADYEVIGKLGEGTFGEVHKARSRKTGRVVAIKKILMHNERDGFPITALREIKLLKMISHINVLQLEEMAIERAKVKDNRKAIVYMVTPYMDHDLSGLLENPEVKLSEPQIKCYMLQLLDGLRFLHASHILHRDMKAANLLINNKGILQIADFGLARYYDGPSPRPGQGGGDGPRDYTQLVVTRWYRPPELLMGLRRYTTAIDLWGVGCIFGEMFEKAPILAGKSDLNQAHMIFDLVGTPNEDNMPGWNSLPGFEGQKDFSPARDGNIDRRFSKLSPPALSLLKNLLCLNYKTRLNAHDALRHAYFTTPPLPALPQDLPKYQESHELDRRRFRDLGKDEHLGALPPAPAGGSVGNDSNNDWYGTAPNFGDRRGYRDRDRNPYRERYRDDRDRFDRYAPPPRYDDRRHDDRRYDDRRYDDRRPPRDGYRDRDRERPPPPSQGPPPPYESRREPRHPPPGDRDRDRPRPAWAREPRPDTLPPRPEGLPPRPPPPADNARIPRDGGGRGGKDTYIPPYSREASGAPREGGRDGRYKTRSRSRSRSPARERRDRERDAGARERENPYGRR